MEDWCASIPDTAAWKAKSKKNSSKKPSEIFVAPSALSSLPQPSPVQLEAINSGPVNMPPQLLVSYPPLALYANTLLTTLNGLRMLAPVELLADLYKSLQNTLAQSAQAFIKYAQLKPWLQDAKSNADESREDTVIQAVGSVYFAVLVPFITRALSDGVYGKTLHTTEEMLEAVEREWEAAFPNASA